MTDTSEIGTTGTGKTETSETGTGKTREYLQTKSPDELIEEIIKLRRRVAELRRNEKKHRRVEKNLRRTEAKWRLFLQKIPTFVADISPEGKIMFLNKVPTGFSIEDFIGKSIFDISSPAGLEKLKTAFTQVIAGGSPEEYEAPDVGPNKSWVWYHYYLLPVKRQTEVISVLMISTDISERRQYEEALKESEDKMRNIIEAVPDAITVTDLTGRIVDCNIAMLRLHGFSSREEILGQRAFDLIAPEEHQKAYENMEKTLTYGSVKAVEYTLLKQSGIRFPAELTANVIVDASENPVSFVAVTKDISDLKRVEKEKEELFHNLNERLKELNCLYALINEMECPGIELEAVLQRMVELIPPAWQYPEITCVRLILEDNEYTSDNFEITDWVQSADIVAHGETGGKIEVFYREERPQIFEGPFMKEERNLLDAMAGRLGKIVEIKRSESRTKTTRKRK